MTIEDIKQKYAQLCAQLGDAVIQQRRLHDSAEHLIRQIEQLSQDARALQAQPESTETPVAAPAPTQE